jgi:hypothetical protein
MLLLLPCLYIHTGCAAQRHTHTKQILAAGRETAVAASGNFVFYVDVTAQCVVVFQGVG